MYDPLTILGTVNTLRSFLSSVKDYLDPRILVFRKRLEGKVHEYDLDAHGDAFFWRDYLIGNYLDAKKLKMENKTKKTLYFGDTIQLKNVNLSRWIPLFPGKFYSKYGKKILDEHYTTFDKDHDYGLEEELISRNNSIFLCGDATSRFSPMNQHYLLSGTSKDGFGVFTGIPILIPAKTYENKLASLIDREGGLNANISATLAEVPWEWQNRFNDKIPPKFKDLYQIPRFILKINDISGIGTGDRIFATAWAEYTDTTIEGMQFFMRSQFCVNDVEDLGKAVNSIANYAGFLNSPLVGGKWVIDTEFDEIIPWFSSKKYKTYAVDHISLFKAYYGSIDGRLR